MFTQPGAPAPGHATTLERKLLCEVPTTCSYILSRAATRAFIASSASEGSPISSAVWVAGATLTAAGCAAGVGAPSVANPVDTGVMGSGFVTGAVTTGAGAGWTTAGCTTGAAAAGGGSTCTVGPALSA